jgi:probable rRNA maturation factor
MTTKRIESIEFHFEKPAFGLKHRRRLKAFILTILKKEKTAVKSIHFVFCSDKRLLKINRDFLRHNYHTDILTFNLADKDAPVHGEIYISLDRVWENAQMLKQFYYVELHRVIFHGVLHLCGYRDRSIKEKLTMRAKEDSYLSVYLKNVSRETR